MRHPLGGKNIIITMNVTPENWKEVERKIRDVGIKESIYNSNDELTTIITKDGERYEVSKELFLQLQRLGLIEFKIGRRINLKNTWRIYANN